MRNRYPDLEDHFAYYGSPPNLNEFLEACNAGSQCLERHARLPRMTDQETKTVTVHLPKRRS
jgi:hypothetical protein